MPTSEGFNFTPAYQISGIPYVTASTPALTPRVDFPFATKFITVRASGSLSFGFTPNCFANNHYFTMADGEYLSMDIRVKSMWFSGSVGGYNLVAGLTGIPTSSVPAVTSSWTWDPADPYFTGSNGYGPAILLYDGVG